MEKFNRARVNLKHFGNLISRDDIAGHKFVVTSFFKFNTKTIFGLEFDNISLLEAVSSKKVKDILSESVKFISNGNKREALTKIAYAYEILFSEYVVDHASYRRFWMRPNDIVHISSREFDYSVRQVLYDLAKAIIKSEEKIHKLTHSSKLSELGIDIASHSKFTKLTPIISIFGHNNNEKYEANFMRSYDIEESEMKFCLDYVIECALMFQSKQDI
jgi:mRNA-degrading endonuclease HigB of HigAB toxin-antitoxin module